MFLHCDLAHTASAENAAGDRARIAHLNRDKRLKAEVVVKEVEFSN
ncbi:MAG: hypothetical protein KKC25_04950 [Proteobacteria bacterium]|nr:hypothetical protein [Pseudomonadota bacterium]MBU2261591.1 hypothetical protein [Pseudomonadota bacterium]